MIRFLLYLVLLCVGLAAAMAWFGEMRHLRMVVPAEQLPPWAAFIEDRATLREGRATASIPGAPPARLSWRAKLPSGGGLLWDVEVSGDGVEALGELTLPWWPKDAFFAAGRGTVAADKLPGGIGGAELIRLTDIRAQVPLMNREARPPGTLSLTMAESTELPGAMRRTLTFLGMLKANTLSVPLIVP